MIIDNKYNRDIAFRDRGKSRKLHGGPRPERMTPSPKLAIEEQ